MYESLGACCFSLGLGAWCYLLFFRGNARKSNVSRGTYRIQLPQEPCKPSVPKPINISSRVSSWVPRDKLSNVPDSPYGRYLQSCRNESLREVSSGPLYETYEELFPDNVSSLTAETRVNFNNMRAATIRHSAGCNIIDCRKEVCFKWEPDKIVGAAYDVNKHIRHASDEECKCFNTKE